MHPRDRDARTGRRHGRPIPIEAEHPESFRWIVDGHNAIFAVADWEALQLQGDRRGARRSLEESLEGFGRAIGSQIWVVYDGNSLERNPDALSSPYLRSEYSLPPEEADDRIRLLARGCVRDGERPVVVTSDRRTLASTLGEGVRWMEVKRFFREVHARTRRRPEKWTPEGLDDLERYFLLRSPFEEDRRAVALPGEGEIAPPPPDRDDRADEPDP